MSRPSEPVLGTLRALIKKKGLNVAGVAERAKLPRGRVRKVLTGSEDMTLDELLAISEALELTPADMGLPDAGDPEEPTPLPTETSSGELDVTDVIEALGNQPEQLFRIAFAMGCDFLFVVETAQLEDSGVPEYIKAQFPERVPIKLDAAFHSYNEPRFSAETIRLTLSFDALYECEFAWTSVLQVTFFPERWEGPPETEEEEEADEPAGAPFLRLVTD